MTGSRERSIEDVLSRIRKIVEHPNDQVSELLQVAGLTHRNSLRDSNLSGADLSGLNLRAYDLTGTELVGTNLRGSDLRGTGLTKTDLDGAIIDDLTRIDGRSFDPFAHLKTVKETVRGKVSDADFFNAIQDLSLLEITVDQDIVLFAPTPYAADLVNRSHASLLAEGWRTAGAACRSLRATNTEISVSRVQRVVAAHFKIAPEARILGSMNPKEIYARHVAMYLCRELTRRTMEAIGQRFDGRSAGGASWAVRKIGRLRRQSPKLDRELTELAQVIQLEAVRAHVQA